MPESYRFALALVVAIVAFGTVLYVVNLTSKPATEFVASFSLEDAISGIKRELQKLENTPGQPLGLILTDVKVALFVQQERSRSSDASLTVPVFDEAKLAASDVMTGQTGSKITVLLTPPRGSQVLSADDGATLEFANLLATTREALRKSMENEPKLEAKSIEVELAFVLTTKRSGSAAVKAKVISLGVASDRKDTSSNTITLTYVNPNHQPKGSGATVTPP